MNNILPEGHFEGWKEFKYLPDGRYMECGYNSHNHHRLVNCVLTCMNTHRGIEE